MRRDDDELVPSKCPSCGTEGSMKSLVADIMDADARQRGREFLLGQGSDDSEHVG